MTKSRDDEAGIQVQALLQHVAETGRVNTRQKSNPDKQAEWYWIWGFH